MEILASRLRIGDTVEVRTIAYQGTGQITEISSVWAKGRGTKLYPAYHVVFHDELSGWFNGVALFQVKG